MPFCTSCGQPYTQPLKFCTACGTAIPSTADMPPVTRPIMQPTAPAQPAPLPPTLSPANTIVEKPATGNRPFNYKPVLLLLLTAGVAFTAYKFFFASNPKKDGAAAAQMKCNCTGKRNAAWPATYQAFITASANRAFISGEEIGACIDSLAAAAEAEYDSCSGEAKNFYATAGKKYVGENSNLFNDAYLKALNECRSREADFNALFTASRKEARQKLSNSIGRTETHRIKDSMVTSNETTTPPQQAQAAEENPTLPVAANQSELVQQLSRFFEAENSVASVADIDNVLDYYSYPMRKNFNLYSVSRERQHQIYKYQYITKNRYHKLYDYQNHIKEIPLADGRTRLEVTFKFETSGNRDGSNSQMQTVTNAYIFNVDGKIESAGLATDKSL